MNAHVERFNRTVQESFVDYHEDLLFTDLDAFNQQLANWLVFYNAERPHHTLGQRPPLRFLLEHHPECQRWWTHTKHSLQAGESDRIESARPASTNSGKPSPGPTAVCESLKVVRAPHRKSRSVPHK
jgi:hypothetical protein